jgi:hypothetical protein
MPLPERRPAVKAAARLDEHLQAYAVANAAENAAARDAKRAKEALNAEMIAQRVAEHEAQCQLGTGQALFRATIAPREVEAMDVAKVLEHATPQQALTIFTATKKAVEEVLGPNAVVACTSTITKPAALSIEKVKA